MRPRVRLRKGKVLGYLEEVDEVQLAVVSEQPASDQKCNGILSAEIDLSSSALSPDEQDLLCCVFAIDILLSSLRVKGTLVALLA